jgi:hypothetical protein
LLSFAIALASLPPPVDAQFGLRRSLKGAVRAPAHILPGGAVPLVVFGGRFRGAFGVVAAVAVGAVIFEALSKAERREVANRAKSVVGKDPDQRVTDTYTSKDGTKQVTIVAEPMQPAADLKNDPAILMVADKVVDPTAKTGTDAGATTAPPEDKPVADVSSAAADKKTEDAPAAKPVVDEEVVKIGDVPPETKCRKVTTDLEVRKKKGQEMADQKTSNTAIFCQIAPGQWKPASS